MCFQPRDQLYIIIKWYLYRSSGAAVARDGKLVSHDIQPTLDAVKALTPQIAASIA